jgi:hypothetical protein
MQRTTTATNGSVNFWLFICVLTSMPDSQQPYPGCEWYQPIAFSNRPTCAPGCRSTYQHRTVHEATRVLSQTLGCTGPCIRSPRLLR